MAIEFLACSHENCEISLPPVFRSIENDNGYGSDKAKNCIWLVERERGEINGARCRCRMRVSSQLSAFSPRVPEVQGWASKWEGRRVRPLVRNTQSFLELPRDTVRRTDSGPNSFVPISLFPFPFCMSPALCNRKIIPLQFSHSLPHRKALLVIIELRI